jgi:hypothetical protein
LPQFCLAEPSASYSADQVDALMGSRLDAVCRFTEAFGAASSRVEPRHDGIET